MSTTKTRICSCCRQPIQVNVGLNADNFKNLFRWPTVQDWILLAVLLLVFVSYYSYTTETQKCRDMIAEMEEEGLFSNTNNNLNVPNFVVDIDNNDTTKEEGQILQNKTTS